MKKIGLVVLVGTVIIFLTSFVYALEPVATAPKRTTEGVGVASDGGWNALKKLEVNTEAPTFDVLPKGIEKVEARIGSIPGKGNEEKMHWGFNIGKHLGGLIKEAIETVKAGLGEIKTGVTGTIRWLLDRPIFGVTREGGVSGYRQEIKSVGEHTEAPDDIIKEITPGS